MIKISAVLSIILIMLIINIVYAGTEMPVKKMTAVKVEKNCITLDGKLTEECWKKIPANEFTQKDPVEGEKETEKTEVWIAYDEENLYLGARLSDSKPDSIDTRLARRDGWFDSDWFYFFVDPYLDKKTGYYFRINPVGTMGDGVLYNDSWDTDTWDGIWEAKTDINENGWTVELKIPFTQFRFKEAERMTWGVNFSRQIMRKFEKDYFVMVPKKESGFVSRFALLEGLNGIKPSQRFEVLPYLVQRGQYLVHDAADPYYKGNQYRTTMGADIKMGIGTALNLDVTINPDFGQVEVDPAVINLSAFESYFNEKRPFFIEGANTFEYGFGGSNSYSSFNFSLPELLYTRRIGRSPRGFLPDYDYSDLPGETRILGAAKLTGKLDESTTLGAISAFTERTFASYKVNGSSFEQEAEPFTHYGVLRARKEFNKGEKALGFMFTSVNRDLRNDSLKNNLSKEAYVFGLDGWAFLDDDQEYVITGAFAGSYISGSKEFITRLQERSYRLFQRPDATYSTLDTNRTSLAGGYGRVMLNKQKGNFYINSALGFITPGFEFNDLGFQTFADKINGHLLIGYYWYEPDNIFRSKSILAAYARTIDFEGNTTSNFLWANSNFKFLNYWGFRVTADYAFDVLSRTLTRGGPVAKYPGAWEVSASAYSDSRKSIELSADCYYSSEKTGGNSFNFGLSLIWKPDPRFNLSFEPRYSLDRPTMQWIDNFSDAYAVNTYKTRYVFANLIQHTIEAAIRINYTFTPSISFQLYLQPFISEGSYSKFKELAKPGTYDYNEFLKNGGEISFNKDDNQYTIDPDGKGPAQPFTFDNPDFNFKSLRGTAVLRWELRPGTLLYLVWTHSQTNDEEAGSFVPMRNFKQLFKSESDNIFLIKFSYWFNI
jgi:hypothetical protein